MCICNIYNLCRLCYYYVYDYTYNTILVDLHTIAAINAKETYENISVGFKNVIDCINNLIRIPVLIVNEDMYELEFFVADYKVAIHMHM